MSLSAFVGSLAQPAVTGSQSYVGVGFRPKLILFWITDQTADGAGAHARAAMGFAASATDQWCGAHASKDAANPTNTSHRADTGCLTAITEGGGTPTVVAAASLTSFDADGFTLNWTTTDGTARIATYLALGGDSLTNVASIDVSSPLATGSQSYTGVGFQPDTLLMLGIQSFNNPPPESQVRGGIHLGAGSDSDQWAFSADDRNGVSPSAVISYDVGAGSGLIRQIDIFSGGLICAASLTSLDAGGFTLNWSVVSATNSIYFRALCLKGVLFKNGTFNSPAATGNQVVSSVGFKPSAILFGSYNIDAGGGTANNARQTFGAAVSSSQRMSVWTGSRHGVSPSNASQALTRTKCITLRTEGGATPTTNDEADFVSMDSGGFTVNWTTASATIRGVNYLALGGRVGQPPLGWIGQWPTVVRPARR